MERLVAKAPEACRTLTVQYRMNRKIMDWSSKEMYENKLIADKSVEESSLQEYLNIDAAGDTLDFLHPLLMIDTAYCGLLETVSEEQDSGYTNEGEAAVIKAHLKQLTSHGIIQERDVAIITPYRAQVALLKSEFPTVEVRTVDGFQGQEREVVVLSLVRSNANGNVGFLSDERRLNVAVTRAKRQVCIVCDSETISNNPFLQRLTQYFLDQGTVRSAAEFVETFSGSEQPKSSNTLMQSRDKQRSKENTHSKQGPKTREQGKTGKVPVASSSSVSNKAPQSKSTVSQHGSEGSKFSFAQLVLDDEEEVSATEGETCRVTESVNPKKAQSEKHSKNRPAHEQADGEEQVSATEGETCQVTESVKPKKAQSEKRSKNRPAPKQALDEDAFLDEAVRAATQCGFASCGAAITLISVDCRYCQKAFCMRHRQPEVHGCGSAVRVRANPRGSGSLTNTAKVEVRGRLQAKIAQEANKRQAKSTKSGKPS